MSIRASRKTQSEGITVACPQAPSGTWATTNVEFTYIVESSANDGDTGAIASSVANEALELVSTDVCPQSVGVSSSIAELSGCVTSWNWGGPDTSSTVLDTCLPSNPDSSSCNLYVSSLMVSHTDACTPEEVTEATIGALMSRNYSPEFLDVVTTAAPDLGVTDVYFAEKSRFYPEPETNLASGGASAVESQSSGRREVSLLGLLMVVLAGFVLSAFCIVVGVLCCSARRMRRNESRESSKETDLEGSMRSTGTKNTSKSSTKGGKNKNKSRAGDASYASSRGSTSDESKPSTLNLDSDDASAYSTSESESDFGMNPRSLMAPMVKEFDTKEESPPSTAVDRSAVGSRSSSATSKATEDRSADDMEQGVVNSVQSRSVPPGFDTNALESSASRTASILSDVQQQEQSAPLFSKSFDSGSTATNAISNRSVAKGLVAGVAAKEIVPLAIARRGSRTYVESTEDSSDDESQHGIVNAVQSRITVPRFPLDPPESPKSRAANRVSDVQEQEQTAVVAAKSLESASGDANDIPMKNKSKGLIAGMMAKDIVSRGRSRRASKNGGETNTVEKTASQREGKEQEESGAVASKALDAGTGDANDIPMKNKSKGLIAGMMAKDIVARGRSRSASKGGGETNTVDKTASQNRVKIVTRERVDHKKASGAETSVKNKHKKATEPKTELDPEAVKVVEKLSKLTPLERLLEKSSSAPADKQALEAAINEMEVLDNLAGQKNNEGLDRSKSVKSGRQSALLDVESGDGQNVEKHAIRHIRSLELEKEKDSSLVSKIFGALDLTQTSETSSAGARTADTAGSKKATKSLAYTKTSLDEGIAIEVAHAKRSSEKIWPARDLVRKLSGRSKVLTDTIDVVVSPPTVNTVPKVEAVDANVNAKKTGKASDDDTLDTSADERFANMSSADEEFDTTDSAYDFTDSADDDIATLTDEKDYAGYDDEDEENLIRSDSWLMNLVPTLTRASAEDDVNSEPVEESKEFRERSTDLSEEDLLEHKSKRTWGFFNSVRKINPRRQKKNNSPEASLTDTETLDDEQQQKNVRWTEDTEFNSENSKTTSLVTESDTASDTALCATSMACMEDSLNVFYDGIIDTCQHHRTARAAAEAAAASPPPSPTRTIGKTVQL